MTDARSGHADFELPGVGRFDFDIVTNLERLGDRIEHSSFRHVVLPMGTVWRGGPHPRPPPRCRSLRAAAFSPQPKNKTAAKNTQHAGPPHHVVTPTKHRKRVR